LKRFKPTQLAPDKSPREKKKTRGKKNVKNDGFIKGQTNQNVGG